MNEYTALKEQLDAAAECPYPPSMQVHPRLYRLLITQRLGKALENVEAAIVQRILGEYAPCKVNALAQNVVQSLEYDLAGSCVLSKLGWFDCRLR